MNKNKMNSVYFLSCFLTSFLVRLHYNYLDKKENRERKIEMENKKKITSENIDKYIIEYINEK